MNQNKKSDSLTDLSKSEAIFSALAAADEELLARSEEEVEKRLKWKVSWRVLTSRNVLIPLTTCLCMVVVGIFLWQSGLLDKTGMGLDMVNRDAEQTTDEVTIAPEASPMDHDGYSMDYSDHSTGTGDLKDENGRLTYGGQSIEEQSISPEEENLITQQDTELGDEFPLLIFADKEVEMLPSLRSETEIAEQLESARSMSGEVYVEMIVTPESEEVVIGNPTCQIYGRDVDARKWEFHVQNDTVYVYEVEFVKEGEESTRVWIKVEGVALQGQEKALDLINRLVLEFLK